MRDVAEAALQAALDAGATYADVRVVEIDTEALAVRNGVLETAERSTSAGVGVRVIADGAWGFSSGFELDGAHPQEVARRAAEVARASALLKRRDVILAPADIEAGRYETLLEEDPFGVGTSDKVGLLVAASEAMRTDERIRAATATMDFRREQSIFASSEGAALEQVIVQSGAGISATAADDHDAQRRSYPTHRGQFGSAGYELVRGLDLPAHGPRIAEEAIALLTAPECPSGETTLILDSEQLALQIHESVGHPTELDRILGTEAAYAGTSFVRPEDRGRLRYASELVSIESNGTSMGGLGTVGWDDEGVRPFPTRLVTDGLLVGFQTSRETAAAIGDERSNGTMRADGWIHFPLIRMTNINLLPGTSSLDELIANTGRGIFMTTNKSWSIDDKRKNFQFGCEIAWEIEDGRLGRMLKNPTYAGMTTDFWGSCDGIAGPGEWKLWGTPNCGKGQPGQVARVGHGAAPARFRRVHVGVRG
ncbi:MAG: TldD/PmbA family protein [Actinomycetota bacterium]